MNQYTLAQREKRYKLDVLRAWACYLLGFIGGILAADFFVFLIGFAAWLILVIVRREEFGK